jgi:outer membrane lipoprotein-sorting protein
LNRLCHLRRFRGPHVGRSVPAIIVIMVLLVAWPGCFQARRPTSPKKRTSLTVADILRRCAAAYDDVETLQVRGRFRDNRSAEPEVSPIAWDLARPDACRLQIGMDVTVVSGKSWWTHDGQTGDFKTLRQITRTPMETAATFLSDGAVFQLPRLFTKGVAAFGLADRRQAGAWRSEGVAWRAKRPCYVVTRGGQDDREPGRLRLWIDQDSFLIRGWTLDLPRPDAPPRTVFDCTYVLITANRRIDSDRFKVQQPTPILLPPEPSPDAGTRRIRPMP